MECLSICFSELCILFAHVFPKNKALKKVMVTGCFDLLHSGHVAFLQEAAGLGELHVCIGSDKNVAQLKGRHPVNPQHERQFMLEALRCVESVRVNRGMGIMDFLEEMRDLRPDIFFVNEDGHTPDKQQICAEQGIEYRVSKRKPAEQLPTRSTTALRVECQIPYRIDLAGGWLDQPWVSELHTGAVITASLEPTIEFNDRSGMASSTRKKAIELWKTQLPSGNLEQLAQQLFSFENPPGTTEIAGSQDSIGIVFPALNKSNYAGKYWPDNIERVENEEVVAFVERHLFLITLGQRRSGYKVLDNTNINFEGAKRLAEAAENCWRAIQNRDLQNFGKAVRDSFEAQISMFPNMVDEQILELIEQFRGKALGWKLSGAGGGGYLVLVAEQPIENAIQVKIRRRQQI